MAVNKALPLLILGGAALFALGGKRDSKKKDSGRDTKDEEELPDVDDGEEAPPGPGPEPAPEPSPKPAPKPPGPNPIGHTNLEPGGHDLLIGHRYGLKAPYRTAKAVVFTRKHLGEGKERDALSHEIEFLGWGNGDQSDEIFIDLKEPGEYYVRLLDSPEGVFVAEWAISAMEE